jgi:hypothetical protein
MLRAVVKLGEEDGDTSPGVIFVVYNLFLTTSLIF